MIKGIRGRTLAAGALGFALSAGIVFWASPMPSWTSAFDALIAGTIGMPSAMMIYLMLKIMLSG